jgi:hypothetical protein
MKTLSLLLIAGIVTGFALTNTKKISPKNTLLSQDFVAHEWGTFTTLHASDGSRFDGLQVEEEHLPGFVYQHDVYSPDEDTSHHIYTTESLIIDGEERLLPKQQMRDRLSYGKGMPKGIKNVTVKMETPVLYFYAPEELDVEVDVKFPQGSISQWYPQRSDGDRPILSHSIDMAEPFNGWINWKGTVLEPNSKKAYSAPKDQLTNTWIAPRQTNSNLIESNGQVEKYLFYRGVANFDIPIQVNFKNAKNLTVKNTGNDAIPYVFVFEKTEDGKMKFWWTGEIGKRGKTTVTLDQPSMDDKKYFGEFKNALVKAGLYEAEAESMLKTWEASYFQKPGFRVFWIVPENFVDRMLPLKISPKPDETKRVFVGRCDVFTPEFEAELVRKYDYEKFRDHRYSAAIQKRYYQLMSEK